MASETRYNQLEKVAVLIAAKTQTLGVMTKSTVYTGFLTPAPILDANNDSVGGFSNSSLSITNSVFLKEVPESGLIVNDGDYFINYKSGYYKVRAGATAGSIATWTVKEFIATMDAGSILLEGVTKEDIEGLQSIATISDKLDEMNQTLLLILQALTN